jgi:Rps23 Pro-64 3,4-dihydroxylase Tpa1-like proline 4-hydroxylase
MSATASAAGPPVEFGPGLDPAAIAAHFSERGRVHIPGILAPAAAERAHRCLAQELPWRLAIEDGRGSRNLQVADTSQLPPAERERLESALLHRAAEGFAFAYDSFPVHECHRDGILMDRYVMRVYEFLNSPAFIGFARTVTGIAAIDYADAQATLYRPGHFLTRHDDTGVQQGRQVAYVLNLTPHWRAEWGGLLAFIGVDGHVLEAYTPAMNALNLFRVPALHAVTEVASYAAAGRYSITGWLRQRLA